MQAIEFIAAIAALVCICGLIVDGVRYRRERRNRLWISSKRAI